MAAVMCLGGGAALLLMPVRVEDDAERQANEYDVRESFA
jgi:hypothetical protein